MNDSKTKKVEISWINALKAICIVFIYVHHSEFYCAHNLGVVRALYKPFFTNAFFFVSGYLLFRKQLSNTVSELNRHDWMSNYGGAFLKNVLFKLVIPTMLFTAITFAPKLLLRGGEVTWVDGIKTVILGEAYWFTCALVVSEIVLFFVLLTRAKTIWPYLITGVITLLISIALNHFGVRFFDNDSAPWYYKSGLVATLFLALGGLYWKYEDIIDHFFKEWRRIFIVVLLAFYLVIMLYFSDCVKCIITNGTINGLGIVMMLVSTWILVFICKHIPEIRLITYVGRHSIGFYFFCGAIPNILAMLLSRFGLASSITTTLICSLLSIVFACPIVYLVNRYFPFVFDFRLIRKHN